MFGVTLLKAPQDYQVIQQENGCGKIVVSAQMDDESDDPCVVCARLCREETGETVIEWKPMQPAGQWCFGGELTGIPIGGPYRLETCVRYTANAELHKHTRGDSRFHLYVGDLYVIAGQSNSAGYGRQPVYDPPERGVCLFRNCGRWDIAAHPLNDSTGTVFPENTEGGNPGHAPWLAFAKMIKRETGIPVGLIQASLGGSSLASWNPEESGHLYRSMLARIRAAGNRVRGVLWYQGCSDSNAAETSSTYQTRFLGFVRQLRSDLDSPELPIFTVQLNRRTGFVSHERDTFWGTVREAQRNAAKAEKNIYVLPANDLTLSDVIHNDSASNIVLGERVARKVLHEIYHRDLPCDAPDLAKAALLADGRVELTFDHVYGQLDFYSESAGRLPFTIEQPDGSVNPIAGYEIHGGRMILITEFPVQAGAHLHIAWQQYPGTLIPRDLTTHIPVLSRYGVPIEMP